MAGSDFGELALVVGDCHIPHRAAGIPEKFKVRRADTHFHTKPTLGGRSGRSAAGSSLCPRTQTATEDLRYAAGTLRHEHRWHAVKHSETNLCR